MTPSDLDKLETLANSATTPEGAWYDHPADVDMYWVEFAEAARTAIPALVAEVRRLRAEKSRSGHYARGRADERAAVVAWVLDATLVSVEEFAERIEAGEHTKADR